MTRSAPARTYRYFQRVQVRSGSGEQSGYFRGCSAYLDNGQFAVLLRRRDNPRLRRPFRLLMLDPPTLEVDDPHNYEGFVPIAPMAA